ncbi:MAG: GNAT family N-acetyltransferase [Phycisphaeraceae bacterium]|nr:GNAT family N-acetyltransferase [Phycisphaeraceae bacterium]
MGVGRAICQRLLEEARRRGYARMKLDTDEQLQAAVCLYESLGFVPSSTLTTIRCRAHNGWQGSDEQVPRSLFLHNMYYRTLY